MESTSDRPPPCLEINVSKWVRVGDEALGTKRKVWLESPEPETAGHWLLKYRTTNTHADGSTHPKGDDWAERVAYGIARVLGLPAAQAELAVETLSGEVVYGVISRSMLAKGEELRLGNELLAMAGIELMGSRRRVGYTTAAIRQALDGVGPPLEALSGLAAWYADRARSPFEGRPHPVAVAAEALNSLDPAVSGHWVSQCGRVEELVQVTRMIPEHRITPAARLFAERVLRRNSSRLLELSPGRGPTASLGLGL